MIAPESVVTFDELEGYQHRQALRLCFGYRVAAAQPAARDLSQPRDADRVAPGEFVSDAEQLRGEALEASTQRANQLGANAVIGLQLSRQREATTDRARSLRSARPCWPCATDPAMLEERARRERLLAHGAATAAACRKCAIGYAAPQQRLRRRRSVRAA